MLLWPLSIGFEHPHVLRWPKKKGKKAQQNREWVLYLPLPWYSPFLYATASVMAAS